MAGEPPSGGFLPRVPIGLHRGRVGILRDCILWFRFFLLAFLAMVRYNSGTAVRWGNGVYRRLETCAGFFLQLRGLARAFSFTCFWYYLKIK